MIKTTPNQILIFLILLFVMTMSLQTFQIFIDINKLLTMAILILFALAILLKPLTPGQLVVFFLTIILTVTQVLFDYIAPDRWVTSSLSGKMNMMLYFPMWCFMFLYLQNYFGEFSDFISSNIRLIHAFCIAWNLMVLISFAYPGSYTQQWGGTYFVSFSDAEHRFASAASYVIALSWILAAHYGLKRYYLYCIIPLIGIFLSGGRTYLGVAALVIAGVYYMELENKKIFLITIIPAMAIAVPIILATPMGDKITSTMVATETRSFWFMVTSGRTDIWTACLETFRDENVIFKLVGGGLTHVQRLLVANGQPMLWAHNDYIHVLLTNGGIGLYVFILVVYQFIKKANITRPAEKKSTFLLMVFFFIWIMNAFFNGSYVYVCAMFSLPFYYYVAVYGQSLKEKAKSGSSAVDNKTIYLGMPPLEWP